MKRAVVVLVAVALFALLAAQVLSQGPLTGIDRELMLFLAAHRAGWVTDGMLALSVVHETRPVLAATALVAVLLAWRGHWRWAVALAAVPTGMVLNVGLKHLFARSRPLPDEPLVQLVTYSFPSGHGVTSTVFYGSLCLLVLAHSRNQGARVAAVAGALAMVALVCFSRLYLGAHYLSDVLASVCVGVVWLAAWTVLAHQGVSRSSSSR